MNVLDLIDDTDNKSGQTVGSTGQSNPTDFTFISPYKRDGGMSPDKQFLAQSLGGVLNKVSYIGANKVFADRISSQIQASQPANENKTGLLDVTKAAEEMRLMDKNPKSKKTSQSDLQAEIEKMGKSMKQAMLDEEIKVLASKAINDPNFNNPTTDEGIDNYMTLAFAINDNKIDAKDVAKIKKGITDYIKSPEYAKRQSNFPEQYIGGAASGYQKNKYETTVAKEKRDKRLSNIAGIPVTIDKENQGVSNYYSPSDNKVYIAENNFPEVVAHELSHPAISKELFRTKYSVLESDRVNAKYWDSVVSKKGKSPFGAGLNISEMNKFVELAKEADPSYEDDAHMSKKKDIIDFTSEQYGDLYGVRQLLYDNGITKSFGEDLDKEKMEKALNNKKIMASPVFKRFNHRYGADNIIELNNTIAMNAPVKTSKIQTA